VTEALVVEDVALSFAGVRALDGVSFRVEPRTVHAVIGPNGAGKTSTFNVICGVYRPDRGGVALGGSRLTGLPPHRIARLGIGRAFQNIALSGRQTVLDRAGSLIRFANLGRFAQDARHLDVPWVVDEPPGGHSPASAGTTGFEGRRAMAALIISAGATPAAMISRGAWARANPTPRPTELAASQPSVEFGSV
jgi:ABC-type Fe3+/spermidine/putrescine transport system ATPase subunit